MDKPTLNIAGTDRWSLSILYANFRSVNGFCNIVVSEKEHKILKETFNAELLFFNYPAWFIIFDSKEDKLEFILTYS